MNSKNHKARVFYTDSEFEAVFGAQTTNAIKMLSKYAEDTCRDCGGECCSRINCEFYSKQFDLCPIFEYRPAKCRLYFCDRILENEALSEAERDFLNKPAVELSDALRQGWGIGIFIEPPIKIGDKSWLTALGIEGEVGEVITSLEAGRLNAAAASGRLMDIVLLCRRNTQEPM